jgi:transposase
VTVVASLEGEPPWAPYISATVSCLPDGDEKLAYDKFHVAAHLGDAVDKVRREEHRLLSCLGDDRLADTRHLWLYHPDNVPASRWNRFKELIDGTSKTARCFGWH